MLEIFVPAFSNELVLTLVFERIEGAVDQQDED
jgi:hypothetical protein